MGGAAAVRRVGWGWGVLALAGLICAPAVLIVHGTPSPVEDVLNLLISLSFIGCGLIAWRRQPDNPVGAVMIMFGAFRGISMFLLGTGTALGVTIGIPLKDSTIVLFVVLLLLFPDGRLKARIDRWILALALIALVPLELVWMAFLPAETRRAGESAPDLRERGRRGRRRHRPAGADHHQPGGARRGADAPLVARERGPPAAADARPRGRRRARAVHRPAWGRQARRAGPAVARVGLLRHIHRRPDRDARPDAPGPPGPRRRRRPARPPPAGPRARAARGCARPRPARPDAHDRLLAARVRELRRARRQADGGHRRGARPRRDADRPRRPADRRAAPRRGAAERPGAARRRRRGGRLLARERPAAGRAARAARRAAELAHAHHRGRAGRAPAAGAQPARRRPAAPRHDVARARDARGAVRHRRRRAAADRAAAQRAGQLARGAARAGARAAPGGAQRPRARGRPRRPGGARAAARLAPPAPRRPPARDARGGGVLPRLGEPHERRQVRRGVVREHRHRRAPTATSSSRSPTTAAAARRPTTGRACAASRTASRRSTGACACGARRAAARSVRAEIPCS